MNVELAQMVKVRREGRTNRWFGCSLSECLVRFEAEAQRQKLKINWDRVLGLFTALAVSALGWTAVGLAVSHFLR